MQKRLTLIKKRLKYGPEAKREEWLQDAKAVVDEEQTLAQAIELMRKLYPSAFSKERKNVDTG